MRFTQDSGRPQAAVLLAPSVVLERHCVRGDVHLRLVLGQVDDAALTPERLAQLGSASFAWSIEPGLDGCAAARAGELHGGRWYRRTPCPISLSEGVPVAYSPPRCKCALHLRLVECAPRARDRAPTMPPGACSSARSASPRSSPPAC